MLVSTKAIVLHYIKYSDSSIVLQLFTEQLGRQSVMVYGIKGKKSSKLVAFQPLYLLDAIIDFKPNRQVQVLKEHKINPPLHNISLDISKSSISIFIAEILSKCLKEEAADEPLFSFISTSINILNELVEGTHLFHLAFLIKLSRYLGFAPDDRSPGIYYYDLKSGKTTNKKPAHDFALSAELYQKLGNLYDEPYTHLVQIKITASERNSIMNAIIQLYEIHAINFNNLKSFAVFKEVFS